MQEKHIVIDVSFKSFINYIRRSKVNLIFVLLLLVIPLSILFAEDVASILSANVKQYYSGDSIIADELNDNFAKLYAKANLLLGEEKDIGLSYIHNSVNNLYNEIRDGFDDLQDRYNEVSSSGIVDPNKGLDSGTVLMWSGSSIDFNDPEKTNLYQKWLPCDGDSGTPNVAKKLITGASSDLMGGSIVDGVLPANVYTLGIGADAVPHKHSLDHQHELIETTKYNNLHYHIWLQLETYLPPSTPWKWTTFTSTSSPISLFQLADSNGSAIGSNSGTLFGVNNVSELGGEITYFITSESGINHNHSVTESGIEAKDYPLALTIPYTDPQENGGNGIYAYPPYYTLWYVIKQ